MSSIAYVADEKMLEYHRLCGSRNISFWRLSARAGFRDFHKGDLLFFYAHGLHSRKKGLVGYAHYDSLHTMSLKQMWNKYGTLNGYDSLEDMGQAVMRASRDHTIPEKMGCLYLTGVVFFRTPVYPKDVGIEINERLESFTYLDKDDSGITVRILREAEKNGLDVWSASQSSEPEYIFKEDELRHQLAMIHYELGKESLPSAEAARTRKLMKEQVKTKSFEMIRGSHTDCFRSDGKTLELCFPFVSNTKDRNERIRNLLGKAVWYKIMIRKEKVQSERVKITVISDEPCADVTELIQEINHTE